MKIVLICFLVITSCQDKITYNQAQLQQLSEQLELKMFAKLAYNDSIELLKLYDYCELNCVNDFSDMSKEANIHCYLRYYIKARLIGSQIQKENKFNNLYILADSLNTERARDLTYISILMNRYIKYYFTQDELLSLFPIQNKFIKTESILIEKVMLTFSLNQDTIGPKKMFDKLKTNSSSYLKALTDYASFCGTQKSPNSVLVNEMNYLKGQKNILESDKQGIYSIFDKIQVNVERNK